MRLSYCGAPFLGWQIQPQEPTVQGTLQTAMSRLLRHDVAITGAGRTDTGVNARMMVAHFDADAPLPADFLYRLNGICGRDIAVQEIWPVPDNAHARFDATQRTYHYYALTEKSPFFHALAWRTVRPLDFEAMNDAAKLLLGCQDFTSFSKLHTQTKTNICTVTQAEWQPVDGSDGAWRFVISADRFLRNMVRAVVGTLVEVGRGKLTAEGLQKVIDSRDRCAAGSSMPGHALYLWDIQYPPELLPEKCGPTIRL